MAKSPKLLAALLGLLLLTAGGGTVAAATEDWALTGYGAVLTGDPLDEVFTLAADFDSSYRLAALALARRLPSPSRQFDLELEGQVVKHFRGQHHTELNALFAARWLPFPWDAHLDTNLAAGIGLSYATEVPELEEQHHDRTARLLAYLLLELEAAHPRMGRWSVVLRTHHRSGAFGLLNNVHGASNAVGLGLKYRF